MKITQETLITNKEVRNNYMNNTQALSAVKHLLLLPNTQLATLAQVAEYYEVPKETIESVLNYNKAEIEADGMKTYKQAEILKELNVEVQCLEKMVGKAVITLKNGEELILPNRGLRLFPRRAILRVGMLLRDSKIAQEVRTQLLNIEEKTSNEVKVYDIEAEQQLQLAIFTATTDSERLMAIAKLNDFQKRHITKLETTNKALAKDKVQYKTPRKLVQSLVVRYASTRYSKNNVGMGWVDLTRELLMKEEKGINLQARKTNAWKRGDFNATLNSVIREDEFPLVIQTITAMCENCGIDVSDILAEAGGLV